MNIRKLLIANRGEIALRIMRSCRSLGIETVLAASDADLDSTPARQSNSVIRLGPARAASSYLDVDAVVAAALAAGADAVHPGYGFLAESPLLARACEAAGLIFVGPTVAQLELFGDKLAARQAASDAGLPVLPGGPVAKAADLDGIEGLAFPVLVKAVGGGGGRGIRIVNDPGKLAAALDIATAEAGAAFGNAALYVEHFVEHARHVEVQLLGDGREVVHLGDRECSVQRRYQKLLEEAPAPGLPDATRAALHEAAVALGRNVGYRGLGTAEFLYDMDRQAFHFLEMNARVQVEHPVTEAITGVDLVAEQLCVAEGRPLRIRQDEVRFEGHAIECRVNAEDPQHDDRPSPGKVTGAWFPAGPGVRVDTHIEPGREVPPWYDSLMAKLIVHGADRPAALAGMRDALAHCRIDGPASNLELHRRILADEEFQSGPVDTGFLARLAARREVEHA